MKKILLLILVLSLFSCNRGSKQVENSFLVLETRLDSLNKVGEEKIKVLFNEINSKRIKKYDGENSALIYNSVVIHNRIVDSLIFRIKSTEEKRLDKKRIAGGFEYIKSDLKTKLNLIKEFDTKPKIDSLLEPSNHIETKTNFLIIYELQIGKLNAIKSAELLLQKLKAKTKHNKNLNKVINQNQFD